MRRAVVVIVLVAVAAMSLSLTAYQAGGVQLPPPGVVEVEKVKDNLFVLKGGGGSTGVFLTASGVVVVDTKYPGWGRPILEKIRGITDKPVTTIINTHTHGDHVSGNVEFPGNVEVVVQENTKANMEKMERRGPRPSETRESLDIFKTNNHRGMATKTFRDKMSIGRGPEQIDLYYFGIGHTNGDLWVVFPSLRIMHAGDMFAGKTVPNIDLVNGGSGVEWGNTLQKVSASVKNVDGIITGHSTMMTMEDLKEYSEFLREFAAAVRDAKKSGKTVDDVVNTWTIPAKYKGYPQPRPAQLKTVVETLYAELK